MISLHNMRHRIGEVMKTSTIGMLMGFMLIVLGIFTKWEGTAYFGGVVILISLMIGADEN